MNKSNLRLVLAVSVLYFAILFLTRGFFPNEITTPLYLLVGPLLLVVLVLASDLAYRASVPSQIAEKPHTSRRLMREVSLLTEQIEVGARASPEYFDDILTVKLREILIEKMSLELGMSRERLREVLANQRLGPGLLKDRELYRLLYSGAPARGWPRLKMLDEAAARIEAWKP